MNRRTQLFLLLLKSFLCKFWYILILKEEVPGITKSYSLIRSHFSVIVWLGNNYLVWRHAACNTRCTLNRLKLLSRHFESTYLIVETIFLAFPATEDISRKISRNVSFVQTEIRFVQWHVTTCIPLSVCFSAHPLRTVSSSASSIIRSFFSRS